MYQTNVVEKIETHILCLVTFCRKSCRLWDNVEKCDGARVATKYVTIWRIRVACWISKATCLYAQQHPPASGHPHARSVARAHTEICNTYCFSTTKMIRERASVLPYAYIASPVFCWKTFFSADKNFRRLLCQIHWLFCRNCCEFVLRGWSLIFKCAFARLLPRGLPRVKYYFATLCSDVTEHPVIAENQGN